MHASIDERFLHFIWKYNLYQKTEFRTLENEAIDALHPGIHNQDAGPDFFNARIKIGNTIWAGNIEIHISSSDWYKHKHDSNNGYKNVILHLVHFHDIAENCMMPYNTPVAILKFDETIILNYSELLHSQTWIACQTHFKTVEQFKFDTWLNNLLIERLEKKATAIQSSLETNKNNREETFYQFLAKGFGFNVNALPFELLAKSLPINYIAKHKNNLLQIEALLFGQAGMLDENLNDEYYHSLQKEYTFLKSKFALQPLEKHLWKFLRLRPTNFPTIRIAQFACLIYKSSGLLSKIVECNSLKEITSYFEITTSEYWETHYTFQKKSKHAIKTFGEEAQNMILINSIIPYMFVYAKSRNNEDMVQKCLQYLEQIRPENNSIIAKWKELNIEVKNAFCSQALIHLKNEYCNAKRCLDCLVGSEIIRKKGIQSIQN